MTNQARQAVRAPLRRCAHSRYLLDDMMYALDKWCSNKHILIQVLAPILASYANDTFLTSKDIKNRLHSGKNYQINDISLWFEQYQRPEAFIHQILSFFKSNIALEQYSENDPMVLRAGLINFSKREYKDEISPSLESEQLANRFTNIIYATSDYSFQFIIFVLLPSLLFYKMTPFQLYSQASSGDIQAIKNLLRLDPYLLHDPIIGEQIQQYRFKDRRRYREILAAPLEPIALNMTPRKMKYSIAGQLSLVSKLLKQPLKEPAIRDFFNAVSWDTKRKEKDLDLPEKRETFRREINRARKSWCNLFITGQEFLQALSGLKV